MTNSYTLTEEAKELMQKVPLGKRSAFISTLVVNALRDEHKHIVHKLNRMVAEARESGLNVEWKILN